MQITSFFIDQPDWRAKLATFYRQELLDNIIPFWHKHAPDRKAGGYHTCLNRDGSVYEHDKLCMWGQGRIAWTFAYLYNELEKRPEWLETAAYGVEFLLKHAYTPNGRMYYSVTRKGLPLEQPVNIHTELSAVLAFSEYARATGDTELKNQTRQLFETCWQFMNNPVNRDRNNGLDPKTLKIRQHGHPMITLNVLQQLRLSQESSEDRSFTDICINTMLNFHQKTEMRLVLEYVGWRNGAILPGTLGRCVNPGHMLEGGVFLIHEARHRNDQTLLKAGLNWIRWGFEAGWDQEFGGIFNDIDSEGLPMPGLNALLADSKLWWQHAEALYALLLAYHVSKDSWFWEAYVKTHNYSFKYFADPLHGEWFALLDRTGRPINHSKGTNRKNSFHIARNFFWAMRLLEKKSF